MTANPGTTDLPADGSMFRRRWEQIAATGYCRRPVRLAGRSMEVDAETGEVLRQYSTEDEPDGVLLVACNNRRASVCPSCSETYQRDAWQLVAAGLRGGKGVPPTVAEQPTVFATFTAPSFGPVHACRASNGKSQPCRPRRSDAACEHGRSTACWTTHRDGEDVVGQPLCTECFDYEALVVWNAGVSELWRRTIIYLKRRLAAASGLTATELRETLRVSYVKVVEYQSRGAVHIHAVMRLDGADGEPPVQPFDVEPLCRALVEVVKAVTVPIEATSRSWEVRWGEQLDLKVVGDSGDVRREAAAAYLAKYATKSVDQFGHLERFRSDRDLEVIAANDHIAELCRTAWRLGADPSLADLGLRRWAHGLGFRGHWSSKSRRYSTTFKALREARRDHARGVRIDTKDGPETVESLGSWRYAGMGHGRGGTIAGGTIDE